MACIVASPRGGRRGKGRLDADVFLDRADVQARYGIGRSKAYELVASPGFRLGDPTRADGAVAELVAGVESFNFGPKTTPANAEHRAQRRAQGRGEGRVRKRPTWPPETNPRRRRPTRPIAGDAIDAAAERSTAAAGTAGGDSKPESPSTIRHSGGPGRTPATRSGRSGALQGPDQHLQVTARTCRK